MIDDDFQTKLVIENMGVPLYSARGVSQTLAPIQAAAYLRRTINGDLVNLGRTQFQKYASRISCTDQRPPSSDGIWPGMLVTVYCVAELCYPVSTMPQRTAVSGSERTEGDFVFYRPVLEMYVIGQTPSTQFSEWTADVQWSLDLEEV